LVFFANYYHSVEVEKRPVAFSGGDFWGPKIEFVKAFEMIEKPFRRGSPRVHEVFVYGFS
jgi:hypothetical protein